MHHQKILAIFLFLTCNVLGEDDADELLDTMLPGTNACLQEHRINIGARIEVLHDCWSNIAPNLTFVVKPDVARQFMKIMCREKKELRCLDDFIDQVSVCLNEDLQIVGEQIMAAFRAADKYVCEGNGAKLIELIQRAGTEQCLTIRQGEMPSCQIPFNHVVQLRSMAAIFDKDNCKIAEKDIRCFSTALRERCNDHEIIEYVEEGLQQMLDSTTCQTYLIPPKSNAVTTHSSLTLKIVFTLISSLLHTYSQD